MKLTEEQLIENWKRVLDIITTEIKGQRQTNLLSLYNNFAERMILAPASGRDYYHGAFPGGYIKHVLNVVDFALSINDLYISKGLVPTYTREALVFSALNHDLGKIGDDEGEYFITHNEKWRKERGEIYIHNGKIRYMDVPDRGLWLLQEFGVKVTQSEMIAIRLHDGMYDEGNNKYLVVFSEDKQLKDDLPHILHHADMMATIIEKNQWKKETGKIKEINNSTPILESKFKSKQLNKITHEFFNNMDNTK